MALQILSCRIPSGDNPHCGVTLEPYVVVKRQLEPGGLPTQVNAADLPEEPTDSRFCIRSRWYRSILSRGGSVCCIHPDREATIQCLLCLRCKVDPRRSYHCSTDCLKQHWDFHKELHEQVRGLCNRGGRPVCCTTVCIHTTTVQHTQQQATATHQQMPRLPREKTPMGRHG